MARKGNKIVCISSAKGGVGKTTLVLNMAGIYSLMKLKTLIIDYDLTNGGIAVSLDKPIANTIFNLADDLKNIRYNDFKNYVTNYNENIDFISCPKDPRQANKIDPSTVSVVLKEAKNYYDVVLVDMSHILNETNVSIMDESDKILFIITNDPIDLKNTKSIMEIFNESNVNKHVIILNNSIHPYKKYFSMYDIKTVIKSNIDYTLSPNFNNKNIDELTMNGIVPSLNSKNYKTFAKDYENLSTLAIKALDVEELLDEE